MNTYRLTLLVSAVMLTSGLTARETSPLQKSITSATGGKVVYLSSLVKRYGSAQTAFNITIATGKTVVDFYADWCSPCNRLSPILNQLAQQFPDVTFLKVNTEQFGSIATDNNVRGIPVLLFFNDGKKVRTEVGFKNRNELTKIITSVLQVTKRSVLIDNKQD